jgi:hypothetical protein
MAPTTLDPEFIAAARMIIEDMANAAGRLARDCDRLVMLAGTLTDDDAPPLRAVTTNRGGLAMIALTEYQCERLEKCADLFGDIAIDAREHADTYARLAKLSAEMHDTLTAALKLSPSKETARIEGDAPERRTSAEAEAHTTAADTRLRGTWGRAGPVAGGLATP